MDPHLFMDRRLPLLVGRIEGMTLDIQHLRLMVDHFWEFRWAPSELLEHHPANGFVGSSPERTVPDPPLVDLEGATFALPVDLPAEEGLWQVYRSAT